MSKIPLIIVGGVFATVIVTVVAVNQATPPATTTSAVSQDSEMTSAAEWINKTQHDTHSVQVAVQSVQEGVTLLQASPDDPGAIASLSGLVKQSQGSLDDAQNNLVTQIDGPMKVQRQGAWYAASELADAMKKLRAYLDSKKPSDLSDFQDKYQPSIASWNDAVTKIWAAAFQASPPTI